MQFKVAQLPYARSAKEITGERHRRRRELILLPMAIRSFDLRRDAFATFTRATIGHAQN